MTPASRASFLVLLLVSNFAAGCSRDPEAKKQQFLASGNKYFEQQNFAAAVIQYRNAVQIDGRFGAARLGLARAHEKAGAPHLAFQEYVRAADLLPDDTDLQLTAATYLLAARQFDEAKARADAVLAREPKNVRAQVVRGNALAGLRQFDEAIAEIEEAIRIDPLRGATHTNLGILEMERGRREEAEKAFSRSIELDPKWVPGHLALGNHYWATGRTADAERTLRTAYELDPANPISARALALFFVASKRAAEAEPFVRALAGSGAVPFALADFYIYQNQPEAAIPELQRLRDRPETSVEAARRLAQAQAIRGDYGAARGVVQEILQKDPNDGKALLLNGQLLAQEGKRSEALTELQKASQAEPNSAAVQFALGRSYAARGDVDQARQSYREVLRLNPRAAAAQVELARLDLATGRPGASVQLAREAVANEPASLEAQLALGRSLLANKDVLGAKAAVEPLLKANPSVGPLHALMGSIYLAQKDSPRARQAFTRALELAPGSLDALGGLIATDYALGNRSAPRARIDAAVAEAPNNPQVWLMAARVYAADKDPAAAERAMRRALEIDPGLLPAYTMLGQFYLSQKRVAEAHREFETLAQKHAKPISALTMLGMIAQMEGDTSKALEHFERVIDLDPRSVIAANNLAWIYAERGEKLDRALQLAQAAAAETPKAPDVLDTLGWVYLKRRASDRAIATFEETVKLAAKNPTYHYHLGLAYAQAEQPALARTSLERALSLDGAHREPWADEARTLLAKVSASRQPGNQ